MKRLRQLFSPPSRSRVSAFFRSLSTRLGTGLIGGLVLLFLLTTTLGGSTVGKQLIVRVSSAAHSLRSIVSDTVSVQYASLSTSPTLRALPSHPDNKLTPYMPPGGQAEATANPAVLRQFHDLLDQFTQRQAGDDNFTVRVIDRRTDDVLELYELTDLRRAHERGNDMEWRVVDRHRRDVTRRLVDKYERRGVPLEDIIVRWGRANQIKRAQERDRPYQAYEIQLAHYLGLSLLPTQIGTVETFNQDDLVSPVGAKSRYQMMPWILRRSGVNEYKLHTEAGSRVNVEEARHPLLTLEPAFLLLRGYINAVGHEIPGLSAYHTGPGNIYKLYRKYYTKSNYYGSSSTVVDAYIWALTEGFDTVSEGTTFGSYSRGYIPSAYGALNATDREALDLSETIRAARVQVRPGASVSLQQLLTVLDTTGHNFNWGPAAREPTIYDRFRAFNAHFELPASPDGTVPAAGNVKLVSSIDGKGIRFFLPLGAPGVLRKAGLDVLDPDLAFRFDGSTFEPPTEQQRTRWDRQYDALVDDIEHFGFTPENRARLLKLHDKFAELAEETPSQYRQRQLDIIRTHRRIWLSNPWDVLSELTLRVTGREKTPAQPPVEIQTADQTSRSFRALTRIP